MATVLFDGTMTLRIPALRPDPTQNPEVLAALQKQCPAFYRALVNGEVTLPADNQGRRLLRVAVPGPGGANAAAVTVALELPADEAPALGCYLPINFSLRLPGGRSPADVTRALRAQIPALADLIANGTVVINDDLEIFTETGGERVEGLNGILAEAAATDPDPA